MPSWAACTCHGASAPVAMVCVSGRRPNIPGQRHKSDAEVIECPFTRCFSRYALPVTMHSRIQRRRERRMPSIPTGGETGRTAEAGSAAHPTSPNAWKWFLALEAGFALIYFPFGIPAQRPFIFGFLPWMEWPGQVFAWALHRAFGGCRHHLRRAPQSAQRPRRLVVRRCRRTALHRRRHRLQVLAPDHGPTEHSVPVVHRCHLHHHVSGVGHRTAPVGPGPSSGWRPGQSDRCPDRHAWRRPGVVDFLIGPNVRSTGGMLVRLTAAAYPLGDVLCWPCWPTCGAQGDSTTPPAGFSPSAPSGPSPPTPSTAWPTSTRH